MIAFDPFDAPWPEVERGDSRGMVAPALLSGLCVLALTLIVLLAVQVTEPQSLAPLQAHDSDMRRYAEAGYFPLMAAARAAARHGLATAAGLQTFGAFATMVFASAYAAWRGFSSRRARGWSNGFWAASLFALCLLPSVFRGFSVQMVDYVIGASVSHKGFLAPGAMAQAPAHWRGILPGLLIVERGVAAAAFVAFFVILFHDMGYRLREALEDFGVIEVDDARLAGARPRGARGGQSRVHAQPHPHPADEGAEESAFGQRDPPPSWSAPPSEEARARSVLGVGMAASKREIERAFRAQMKRAHPDHGGSVERAAALNAARDRLLGRR
jgi:hypothetical protein